MDAKEDFDDTTAKPAKKEQTTFGFLPYLFRKSDQAIAMMRVFGDFDGTTNTLTQHLQISSSEKRLWVQIWLEIDVNRNNAMEYSGTI